MIYFDNSSTSFPKAPGVGSNMYELIENNAFNINRGMYNESYALEDTVYETRELLCRLFNFKKIDNVIFTPSITYSLNMFIKGFFKPGDHVIVSSMEHNAVMRPLSQMKSLGIDFSVAQCRSDGSISPDKFETLIKENTKAILCIHGSNVCGTLLPIRDIGLIAKRHNLTFAVDSAQTGGVVPIDMQECNINFLAFTGHKGLLGPQGIGGFLADDTVCCNMTPLIAGGTGSVSDSEIQPSFMPDKFESGTLNIPGIIGLNTSIKYINKIGLSEISEKEMYITEYFLNGIQNIDSINIIGKKDLINRLAVVSLDFLNIDNANAAFILDKNYHISTRVGLHCAPRAHKTLGTYPKGTVRFSFGYFNTKSEVDICLSALNNIVK